nr:vegetative cell wall protein gp1-like [Lolium perenne]
MMPGHLAPSPHLASPTGPEPLPLNPPTSSLNSPCSRIRSRPRLPKLLAGVRPRHAASSRPSLSGGPTLGLAVDTPWSASPCRPSSTASPSPGTAAAPPAGATRAAGHLPHRRHIIRLVSRHAYATYP